MPAIKVVDAAESVADILRDAADATRREGVEDGITPSLVIAADASVEE